jgi:hypothetical protein
LGGLILIAMQKKAHSSGTITARRKSARVLHAMCNVVSHRERR